MSKREPLDGRAGVWDTVSWCAGAGMSVPTKLRLPIQPKQTKIGRLVRITESPQAYFDRVRELQQRAAQNEVALT
jgi:hypothetical protein